MNLPQANKLSGYLLSEVGRGKARFLQIHGFTERDQDRLSIALLELARTEEINDVFETPYGTKYIIEGMIPTPPGGSINLRTVWIVEPDGPGPRFVTAYPIS